MKKNRVSTETKRIIFAIGLLLLNSQLLPFVGPAKREEGNNNIYDFTNIPKEFWTAQSIGDNSGTIYTMQNDTNYPAYVRVGYHEWGCWGTGLQMPAKFYRVMVTNKGCSPQRLTGWIMKDGQKINLKQGDGIKGANNTHWRVIEEGGTFVIKLIR